MESKELKAFYINKNDMLYNANISINGESINIKTFDQAGNNTGYSNIFYQPNKRFYLDTIYCYDKFRGNGVATFINELIEYLLKDYEGYVIRGRYMPTQLSTDIIDRIYRSDEELDLMARNFYTKFGYEIVDYNEYLKNMVKYPYLRKKDFKIGEELSVIVAKPIIKKEHLFFEDNGILYFDDSKRKDVDESITFNDELNKSRYVRVEIGNEDRKIVTYKKRGQKYKLSDGSYAIAGYEDNEQKDKDSFVKKLSKRFYKK